jgi:hypothetical protein
MTDEGRIARALRERTIAPVDCELGQEHQRGQWREG